MFDLKVIMAPYENDVNHWKQKKNTTMMTMMMVMIMIFSDLNFERL